MTNGGAQQVQIYKVNDIWKLNVEHYKGASESAPLSKGGDESAQGANERSKGGDERHTTKNNKTIKPSELRSQTYEIVGSPSDLVGELGDSKSPRISGDKKKAYDELIAWSEQERGFVFPPTFKTKQYKAFKLANQNEITREQLMERWSEMATEKFWQKNGFDWLDVFNSFSKKSV